MLTPAYGHAVNAFLSCFPVCQCVRRRQLAFVAAGHVNEKNFVGLSVTPAGYIATGSEDNCVVAYHASIPVPIARHCFSEHGRQPGASRTADETKLPAAR